MLDLKKVLTVKYSTREPEQWRAMATLAIFISLSSGLSKRMLENWGDHQQYNQQLTNHKHKHQHQHYSSAWASTSMISVSIVSASIRRP